MEEILEALLPWRPQCYPIFYILLRPSIPTKTSISKAASFQYPLDTSIPLFPLKNSLEGRDSSLFIPEFSLPHQVKCPALIRLNRYFLKNKVCKRIKTSPLQRGGTGRGIKTYNKCS